MIGNASVASSTTEAPTMPVDAASSRPMITTVIASPPRSRPKTLTKFVIRFSAMPERSSIRPMNEVGQAAAPILHRVPDAPPRARRRQSMPIAPKSASG
jgi:hypothetical protein